MKSGRTLLFLAVRVARPEHGQPSAFWLLFAALIFLFSFAGACAAEVTGNTIILMIGDGMGFKHVEITKNYVGTTLTMQTLPVQLGCTTFMRGGSYNSSLAWSNFTYVKSGATDSGAAGTTLSTGIKTSSGRISVNHDATARLKMMTEHVRDRGWSSGVISSVPFSHATPAAFGAHNNSRNNYTAIAREMITTYGDGTGAWGNTPTVDVIIGGGHPDYVSGWISSTEYNALKNGTTGQGWTFVERQTGVNGTTSLLNAAAGATKLFGLYGGTDRCIPYRLADGSGRNYENPTLVDMTVAALNVLSKNTTGRFLMIEGGSIDWASHDNNINRMIGEMIDFDQSVAAVVDWVDANDPTWSNTLLIVTADHETGYLTRGSGVFANVALANPGTGVLPTAGVILRGTAESIRIPWCLSMLKAPVRSF
jgi:alkaline phosphatase